MAATAGAATLLPGRILCLVTDRRPAGSVPELLGAVEAAIRGGANMVQLRERDAPAADLLRMARALREMTEGRALLIVNDRADVALAAAADGVQLGERSLPVEAARRVCGRNILLGRSVHSRDGARAAEREGADYLVLGTVFASRSHPGGEAGGPGLVREVADAVELPVIGIGGIDASNAGAVIEAGARGVAAIGAILGDTDPEAAARRLAEAIGAPGTR